jgi:hypothetical protein
MHEDDKRVQVELSTQVERKKQVRIEEKGFAHEQA